MIGIKNSKAIAVTATTLIEKSMVVGFTILFDDFGVGSCFGFGLRYVEPIRF